MSSLNLSGAFAEAAARAPGRAALYWAESEHTYQEYAAQAGLLAARLAGAMGVAPGDRVGLWLRNCPEFVPAFFGILQAGAVAVPVNNFLKPAEVVHILEDSGAEVVIVDESLRASVEAVAAARPGLRVLWVEEWPAGGGPGPEARQGLEDLAVILYTSGTTGRPKGAMLTHGNLLHNVRSIQEMMEMDERDCLVVVLPMFHSFMLTVGMLSPLLAGGSVLLIKHLQSPKAILREIQLRQATVLPAVPQFFRAFLHAHPPQDLSLRLCISGGAPLPREVLREFNQQLPLPLVEGYGLSECSPVASFNPLRGPWKAGSIGLPIPRVEMSIQDEEGRLLGPEQTGEVCVRGGNVMPGYWGRPEESALALRNGWLLTGDIGRRDSDGYYYITDRKKDMLLVNGINVYPREIEEILYECPGIREAAVIGAPDSRRGEQPLAFVSCAEGAVVDEKALHEFLRERLADYKVPKRFVTLPELPRNSTGKILKTVLRTLPG